jgi:hypothetical protein
MTAKAYRMTAEAYSGKNNAEIKNKSKSKGNSKG